MARAWHRGCGVVVALALCASGTALAYLLPADRLVRRVQGHREELGLHTLQVTGTFLFTGQAAETLAQKLGQPLDQGAFIVPAVAFYKMPGRCRIELAPPGVPDSQRPFAANRYAAASGSGDAQLAQTLLALACPILSSRGNEEGSRQMIDWLKKLGVDFSVGSLARFEGGIAQVIGARPRDLAHPQIWIDKDLFQVVRLIARQGEGLYDVRFIDYGAPTSGDWHPREVELWSTEPQPALLARFSAEKVDPNAKIADEIF